MTAAPSWLSAAQVKARGLKVESDDPTGKLFEPTDPRTGDKLPARLLIPDPGFAYHPGKEVWGGLADVKKGSRFTKANRA